MTEFRLNFGDHRLHAWIDDRKGSDEPTVGIVWKNREGRTLHQPIYIPQYYAADALDAIAAFVRVSLANGRDNEATTGGGMRWAEQAQRLLDSMK